MKNKIVVSAPGKLVLFGEQAAVHGEPCIVTSVNQRLKLSAERIDENKLILNAADVNINDYEKPLSLIGTGEIPSGAKYVEFATKNFMEKYEIKGGIKFETFSEFKTVFGFGSSSAVIICVVSALTKLFHVDMSEEEIFKISHKTVLDVAGIGSGIDLAAAIYGNTIYFVTPGKVIEPLNLKSLPIVIGFTGVKFDTPTLVKHVSERAKQYPEIYKTIFNTIGSIVDDAKVALQRKDYHWVGELMNFNQGLLDTMGVNSGILSKLIYAARDAGAYGAKLSGAGGGDCMIAIVSEEKRKDVEKAIEHAGGQVLHVEVNAKGIIFEND